MYNALGRWAFVANNEGIMKKPEFDPLEYIENAFLDKRKPEPRLDVTDPSIPIPTLGAYLGNEELSKAKRPTDAADGRKRFKKTQMSAPRPRRREATAPAAVDPELQDAWQHLPRSVAFLIEYFDDSVTAKSYGGEFKETRHELIRRILDPELTLEETARLLGVCPATVRRYTNRGWLVHHRTKGGQRRFKLSGVVKFVEAHGRFPEEK